MAPTHFSRMINILALVCLGLISKVEAQMGVEFQVQFPYMPEGQQILMMYSTMMNKFDVYVTAPMWQNPVFEKVALNRLQVTTYVVQRKYITSRSGTTTSIVAKGKFQFGMTVFMPVSFHSAASFLAIPTSGWGAEYFILIPNFNWKRDVINRWQTSFSRLETGTRYISSANRSLIKLETRQIERLEEEIRPLIEEDFTWKDAFAQYTLQNVLLAFSRGLSFNRRLSEAALVDARDGPDVDGENNRDEIVQVHKYSDKPNGLFNRHMYYNLPETEYQRASIYRNLPTESLPPIPEESTNLSWEYGLLMVLFSQNKIIQIVILLHATVSNAVAQEKSFDSALSLAESTVCVNTLTVLYAVTIITLLIFLLVIISLHFYNKAKLMEIQKKHFEEKNKEQAIEIAANKILFYLEWKKSLVPAPNG
ncbi:uncharacterized protein LOC131946152 [Physella acuta]|uniref:uncharacterized protein LOC131946152 n=1 Tax=Physella acuta TaxID=109671 RepID=UPI0027DD0C92|nr:uncharacterized protein LOC131946152 [Physella acuta]